MHEAQGADRTIRVRVKFPTVFWAVLLCCAPSSVLSSRKEAPPELFETRLKLVIRSNGEANFIGIPGAEGLPKTQIQSYFAGVLRLTGRELSRTMIASFIPSKVTLTENGSEARAVTARIGKELSLPFLVTFTPSGIIDSCQFEGNISAGAKRLVLSAVSCLQCFNPGAKTVVRTEPTSTGSCSFEYRLVKHESHVIFLSKSPAKMAPPDLEVSGATPLNLLSGRLELAMDRSSKSFPVRGVEGEIDERTIWRKKEVAHSASLIRIVREAQGKSSVIQADFDKRVQALAGSHRDPIYYQAPASEIQNNIQTNELGNLKAADVVALLQPLGDTPEGHRDLTATYLKVHALLYVHPESAASWGRFFSRVRPKARYFKSSREPSAR